MNDLSRLNEALARLDALDHAIQGLVEQIDVTRDLVAKCTVEANADTQAAAAAPAADARRSVADEPAIREAIRQFLREVGSADLTAMPAPRLRHWVQATVAHARHYQERAPEDLGQRLDRLIRRMHRLTAEQGLGFIAGLKRDAVRDWLELAEGARRGIERFDWDTQQPLQQHRSSRPSPRPLAIGGAKDHATPVPRLAALTREAPILVFGGKRMPEIINRAGKDWDLSIEWAGCVGPRHSAQAVERIRGRSYSAVIVLEGRVAHSLTNKLFDVLRRGTTPWARCGTPGLAQLRQALVDLEEQLARDPAVAV